MAFRATRFALVFGMAFATALTILAITTWARAPDSQSEWSAPIAPKQPIYRSQLRTAASGLDAALAATAEAWNEATRGGPFDDHRRLHPPDNFSITLRPMNPLRLSPTGRAVVFLRAVVHEPLQRLLLPLPS
jgi:hypothetical protein